jgi:hypothetical protein
MIIEVKKPITKAKLNKAAQILANSQNKNGKKIFKAYKHFGKLKGVFGNALEYQKKMRNEWN